MSVIRVKKNKNYTTMSNYHLKDKNLSLKAKGLLSMILSLPDSWHYSVRGLSSICKEGKDSISRILRELEECGYVYRQQARAAGRFTQIEYIVFEDPKFNTYNSCADNPCTESPCPNFRDTVNADAYKILIQSSTKKLNTDVINHMPNQSEGTDTRPAELVKYFKQVFGVSAPQTFTSTVCTALSAGLSFGNVRQAIDDAFLYNPQNPSAYVVKVLQDYANKGGAPMLSLANQERHPDDPLTQCERDWLEEFYAASRMTFTGSNGSTDSL